MDETALYGRCLIIAYDGSDFAGSQVQPGRRTVQGELERAAATMTGHPVRMRFAGRTDAGVHALGQAVAFDSARDIAPRGFVLGLNRTLPPDLRVLRAGRCAAGYAPRFDAMGKTYRYVAQLAPARDPLLRMRAYQLTRLRQLDFAAMRAAAAQLTGTHDFRAFRSADDARDNNVRSIYSIDIQQDYAGDPSLFAITVHGSAFMKNMVRILSGTLIDIGSGKRALADVPRMLGPEASRSDTGQTAPAHGLTLLEVELGRGGTPPHFEAAD